MTDGALSGLRVLDFTRALSGPFCTRLLVEAGAEVIKVEPLGHGDFARDLLPAYEPGRSGYFHQQNFGKRSVAVDLKDAHVRDALLAAAEECDVIVENFRPGVMDRVGLGYSQVAARNPGIVYCSISGYGQRSRFANRPGQDIASQARSGLLDTVRSPDGEPIVPNTSLTDIVCGTHAFVAVIGALLRRGESGAGCWIDSAIVASALQLHESPQDAARWAAARAESHPSCSGGHVPRGIFATADGWLALDATDGAAWRALCGLLERADWEAMSADDRLERRTEVLDAAAGWLSAATTVEAEHRLREAGIPAQHVKSCSELRDDVALRESGQVRPFAGDANIGLVTSPLSVFGSRTTPAAAEPLGHSTYAVLREYAGLPDHEILDLLARGAVECASDSLPPGFPGTAPAAKRPRDLWRSPAGPSRLRVLEAGDSLAVQEAGRLLALCGHEVTDSVKELAAQAASAARCNVLLTDDLAEATRRWPSTDSLRVVEFASQVAPAWAAEVISQAAGGLSYIYGEEDGSPYEFGYPVVGVVSGALLAAACMLGSLSAGQRVVTVRPEHTALMMHDTALTEAMWGAGDGEPRGTADRRSLVPYGTYRAPDGHVAIGASQGGFVKLAQAIDRPDLLEDERFATLRARVENRALVRQVIEGWLARAGSVRAAEEYLSAAGVVCAPVRSVAEALGDEDLTDNGWVVEAHGSRDPGSPFQYLDTEEAPERQPTGVAASNEGAIR